MKLLNIVIFSIFSVLTLSACGESKDSAKDLEAKFKQENLKNACLIEKQANLKLSDECKDILKE